MTGSSNPTQAGVTPGLPRDAILFIPGLDEPGREQTSEEVARRIATALDRYASNAKAEFTIEMRTEEYRDGSRADVCTISRSEARGAPQVPVVDVYRLDHMPVLTRGFAERSALVKGLLILLAILKNTKLTVVAFIGPRRTGKSFPERLQWLYATWILLLLAGYLFLLGTALLELAAGLPSAESLEGLPEWAQVPLEWLRAIPAAGVVVAVSAFGTLVPRDTQAQVATMARNYFCLTQYLNVGDRRAALTGRIEGMLEHIAEKDVAYRRVHIVSFSFGAVLAMDALFPSGGLPTPRLKLVNALVTIGCPFDLVRTFWPKYFGSRRRLRGVPAKWINVYAPTDVLASNFRDDTELREAEIGVKLRPSAKRRRDPKPEHNIPYGDPRRLGLLDVVMLLGLRAHGSYWERTFEAESSCFHQVVKELYRDDALLA